MTVLIFAHFALLWENYAHFWEYSALTEQGMPYLVRVYRHQGPYSQHSIFFLTYEWSNKLECYITLGWKGLPGTNTRAYSAHL
jgi:hypothetical protein